MYIIDIVKRQSAYEHLLLLLPFQSDSCFDMWSSTNPSLPENPNLQRQWDDIKSSSRSVALRPLLDQHRLACLSSATQPNSGAWMNCLPSTAIGTLLDNESFRIAISQRLGLPVCAPHKCRLGHLAASISGERREAEFLRQRL